MSTGFTYVARDTGHTAIPLDGTYVREADGKPASLIDGADSPVSGQCKICHGRIRLGHLLQWEWRHASDVTATAGEAS